jgi:glycosyltransferase involved in cell wall biosynthesis
MSPRCRVVQLTDWLPPEFSAVSQYALLIAEAEATLGAHVTVVGLSSGDIPPCYRKFDTGSLTVLALRRPQFERDNWIRRLGWIFFTNIFLLKSAWPYMRKAHIIRFTGSPPFLLHFVSLANLLLRKRLVYRITDFYPECVIAALDRPNRMLEAFRRFSNVLRRRVDHFEVIGEDMRAKLLQCGVRTDRISLRRDASPVKIGSTTPPLPRPSVLGSRRIILYSGNWGVAHDVDTFFEGYRRHHQHGSGSVGLWLNATGSGAESLDKKLRAAGLPFHRQKLVGLDQLPNLLVSADAHLITLRPRFEGLVLPSKVYGCIASKLPVLFVGPIGSDVHLLCSSEPELRYIHVNVGDEDGVESALETLAKTDLQRPP